MPFEDPTTTLPASSIEGEIQGTQLAADAIDGMVITGATLQTAHTGKRIVMGPDGKIVLYSGAESETVPALFESSVGIVNGQEIGISSLTAPGHSGLSPARLTMSVQPDGEQRWDIGPILAYDSDSGSGVMLSGPLAATDVTILGNLDAGEVKAGHVYTDAVWSALPLEPGWTGYGSTYGTGRYRRMPDGSVILRDLVKRTAQTTIANGAVLATLPSAYRPVTNHQQNIWVGGSTGGACSLNINAGSGTVTLSNLSSGAVTYLSTGSGYVSLNGVQFFTD